MKTDNQFEFVKFNNALHELRQSSTDCGNIHTLFHAVGFATLDKEKGYLIPGIDAPSLETLERIVESVKTWINSSNGVIGLLLAYADHAELHTNDMSTVGWLLTGLSEIQQSIDYAESVIKHTKADLKNQN